MLAQPCHGPVGGAVKRRGPGRGRGFRRFRRFRRSLLVPLALATSLWPVPLEAQGTPPQTGAVPAGLLLRQMDGVKRVLVIGAHPDDEDTSLLAALARGRGARAAYLSLTRGEGGQNLIGPELGEALGLVRTGELLAARRLDGAEQYFTRAYDFGYSKSVEETFRHWPRDSLLADVVWVVRTFRPQVLVSVFSGTPQDGHGQHQVAGILAREAFHAAGDPERFPEQLARGARPWTPLKLYRRTFRDPDAATLRVPTGELDPLLGRSHHQVAMESRSQHRSQDFGTAQPGGPRASRLRLLERRVGAGPDTSLFAGVDTALASVARDLPAAARVDLEGAIAAYRAEVRAARADLNALSPEAAAPALARALVALRRAAGLAAAAGQAGAPAAAVLREKERIAQEALLAASSVTWTLRSDDDLIVPGQAVTVTAELWNGGPYGVTVRHAGLEAPEGWGLEETEPPPEPRWPFGTDAPDEDDAPDEEEAGPAGSGPDGPAVPPGRLDRRGFAVRPATDAPVSRPYYLREARAGDLYRWPDAPELWALPREPPILRGFTVVELEVGGDPVALRIERPVRYRGVDKARGESWRPVLVAPSLSVRLEPSILVWPTGAEGPRELTVALRWVEPGTAVGRVRLEAPEGWRAEPPVREVRLEGEGAAAALSYRIEKSGPGAVPEGEHPIRAVAALSDGRRFSSGFRVIDHPHIDPWLHFREASAALRAFPVEVARGRRVGYVMGSGDDVPEAIRQLGMEVELLEPPRVESGAFGDFDVVVLGIRAYETRPELRRANHRLLEWVRRGGTLIVQYNKYEYEEGGFAPYRVAMSRPHDRATDETAPVSFLAPDAPAFRTPNRIGEADFDGWVQERGLYFLGEWEPPFVPLLSTADPGEDPKRGALLVAPVGEGVYVYTGLALFRQLPAGVPGAYRLFANLLSVRPAEWRAWLDGRGAAAGR